MYNLKIKKQNKKTSFFFFLNFIALKNTPKNFVLIFQIFSRIFFSLHAFIILFFLPRNFHDK